MPNLKELVIIGDGFAAALFGGFTPLVSTWLIETTGDKASPGYWLAMAGGMGLIATILIYKGIIKARD
jgi:MHS family citrate/tricarballylate:H+ symporter-like MFS transporter